MIEKGRCRNWVLYFQSADVIVLCHDDFMIKTIAKRDDKQTLVSYV